MIKSIFIGNSVLNNPGLGVSIAIHFINKDPVSAIFSYSKNVSSQAADLIATKLALNNFGEEIALLSHNEYVVNAMNAWVEKWAENNWLNKDFKEIKNRDLFKSIYERKKEMAYCDFVKAGKPFAHNTDIIKSTSKRILEDILAQRVSFKEGVVYPVNLDKPVEILDM